MDNVLGYEYWGNTVQDYLIVAAIIIGSIILTHIIKAFAVSKITKRKEDDTLSDRREFFLATVKRLIVPFLYLAGFYVALNSLDYSPTARKVLHTLFIILVTWFAARYIIIVIEYFINSYFRKVKRVEDTNKLKPILGILNMLIYMVGFVFVLDNLGFEISTIIAGLGISGIAIALAAQTVLGDLFAYFVVVFDKPFEVGDFIIFGDKLGVIEKVGIKSTRVRALSGEQLIVSNSDLTNSRIHNFKRMERRRVVFKLGVIYQTPYDKVKEIPGIIKEIITANDSTTFDRSHFSSYGDFSLNFETVYYVLTNDYTKYMDIQQEINLKLYQEFEKRGIEFAFPTQTLFVNRENGNGEKEE